MFNYFQIPDFYAGTTKDISRTRSELADFVELFQSRAALFLLFFSLEAQALEGPVGRAGISLEAPARPLFPQIHWNEQEEEEPSNRGRTTQIKEMQRELAFAVVNPEYMVLCRWPDFFSAYQDCLKTVLASPLYSDWQLSTRALAWRLAQELPGPVELSAEKLSQSGVQQRDLSAIANVSDRYLDNLSGLLLNMAVARIGLEQGSRPAGASVSPAEKPPKAISIKPGRVA
jgi:hypothetical protein